MEHVIAFAVYHVMHLVVREQRKRAGFTCGCITVLILRRARQIEGVQNAEAAT